MSERSAASGTVHWIGTGLSTGSGLRLVAEQADRVLVWGRSVAKAAACIQRLGLPDAASPHAFELAALQAELRPGDVVVSMLPATEHLALVRLCIAGQAHFACSSYVSAEILAEVPAAEQAGVVLLTEAGLDPGLDHVLAHLLVEAARAEVGTDAQAVEFISHCGGIPAVPNDFKYRFSWAPRGVLTALLSQARYIEHGEQQLSERPWQATRPQVFNGESFEVYPNRDSLPFIAQYDLPVGWQLDTFMRGTLRLDGWRDAWSAVFAELPTAGAERISELATDLAGRYPTTEDDLDRVVLVVALSARGADGRSWAGQYLLDLVGEHGESAMARCVSVPLAFGIGEILTGRTSAGLHRAAETAAEAARWLAFCAEHGIAVQHTEPVLSDVSASVSAAP
ncbi:MAG: saccharopine dehydrogenase NADP-binding domain-containing protein [Actinomycetota bacterium]|nr:saccharopine dehydrogenase NADP-binding domain-containing protein [Actinomycetota bacterium]